MCSSGLKSDPVTLLGLIKTIFSSLFELAHAAFWGHTHSIWYKWSLKHTLCQFQALLLTTDYPLRSQHQEMSECDELYRNSRDLWYCLRWVTPEDFGKEYRASWLADAAPVGLVIIHSHVSHSVPGTEGFGPAGLVQPEAEQKWREEDKCLSCMYVESSTQCPQMQAVAVKYSHKNAC